MPNLEFITVFDYQTAGPRRDAAFTEIGKGLLTLMRSKPDMAVGCACAGVTWLFGTQLGFVSCGVRIFLFPISWC